MVKVCVCFSFCVSLCVSVSVSLSIYHSFSVSRSDARCKNCIPLLTRLTSIQMWTSVRQTMVAATANASALTRWDPCHATIARLAIPTMARRAAKVCDRLLVHSTNWCLSRKPWIRLLVHVDLFSLIFPGRSGHG